MNYPTSAFLKYLPTQMIFSFPFCYRTRYLEIDVNGPAEYGDYFAIVQNSDGLEERVKALSLEGKHCLTLCNEYYK